MKKKLLIPAICLLLASCSCNTNCTDCSNKDNQTQSKSTQPADWEITASVKKNLMSDNSLSKRARIISVTTKKGVVTLSGKTASKDEMHKVVRMVKKMHGVVRVDNQLEVSDS
jgi:osmotically-inducible protein OsmY